MKKYLLLVSFVFATLANHAQTPAKEWAKKFPGNVKWYQISDAGILIVCTGDALYGLNPETGEESWKIDKLDDVKEENYDAVEGTPYAALIKSSLMKGAQHTIIDISNGKLIASSPDFDILNIVKRIHIKELNAMMMYGFSKSNGKPTMVMFSLVDGHKIWEQKKLFEKNSEEVVSNGLSVDDGIYIATTKNLYKLNPASGEIIWSQDRKTEKPVAAVVESKGMFGKKSRVDLSANATSSSAQFFLRNNDKSRIWFWNQEALFAFNPADGKPVTKEVELESPVGYILYDTHGMLVATAEKTQKDMAKGGGGGGLLGKIKSSGGGKNRATLLCIDPETGDKKWKDEIDLKGDVNAYKLVGNKLILATQKDNGDNFISLIDLDAGKSVTKKPLSVNGDIRDLEIVPQGLYYRTSDEINILDLESGDKTWKKGFKVKQCAGDNANDKLGYVFANDIIYKVDFTTGDIQEWIKDIKFDGKEDPTSLQVRENGILVTSEQNASLFSNDGKLVWHSFNKAPGKTLTGKMLSGLGGLAATMMAAQQAGEAARLSYAKGYYGSTSPALDNDIKNANANAAAFAGAAAASFAAIGKRFKATRQANDFMAVMTVLGNNNQASSSGCVIVSKTDGKNIASILLGDKTPDYKLDELGRMIYQKSESDEIKGFKF
ncbi:MAG: PQQ-binding-like beta-propeller repeat protein [Chitinophagaceae bacterium]|nr:PQQ-binding-like beta-propeller repeat protein [Chitinophagaceae bacterium]